MTEWTKGYDGEETTGDSHPSLLPAFIAPLDNGWYWTTYDIATSEVIAGGYEANKESAKSAAIANLDKLI